MEYYIAVAGNLPIPLAAWRTKFSPRLCDKFWMKKQNYVQVRVRAQFVPSWLGHMLVTWFQLTSSLVVSILAMSQVCMAASPDTEMRESPQIPNSITVHTPSRRRQQLKSNVPHLLPEWYSYCHIATFTLVRCSLIPSPHTTACSTSSAICTSSMEWGLGMRLLVG